jgi:hypothetical protein
MPASDTTIQTLMQTEANAGKLVVVAIGIVAAALSLSRAAYGMPSKGDHRAVTYFIVSIFGLVMVVAANISGILVGFFSPFVATLFSLWVLTQIAGFFLVSDSYTRAAVFNLALLMAFVVSYIDSYTTSWMVDLQFRALQTVTDSYVDTTKRTISELDSLRTRVDHLTTLVETKTK